MDVLPMDEEGGMAAEEIKDVADRIENTIVEIIDEKATEEIDGLRDETMSTGEEAPMEPMLPPEPPMDMEEEFETEPEEEEEEEEGEVEEEGEEDEGGAEAEEATGPMPY